MSEVAIPAVEGRLRGHLAIPDGDGPWPGVLVVHDVLGVTTDLKRITDRFAASGYLAIAPSLYDGPGPKIKCVVSTIRAHFTGHGLSYSNILAARDYLISDTRCTGKVGLAGFCMGAGFCLQLAPGGLFDVVAPSYAILPKDVEKLEHSCPVVGSFGARDPIVASDTAERLEAVLASGDVPRDVKKYPRAGHSFMNEHPLPAPIRLVAGIAGIAYSAPEAEDAWQRILSFFGDHLDVAGTDLTGR
ncbi:dienelactone hydrolase family protein [Mycolicibacterium sphagni]|uniref:dienelactone hydrolase family protein n=1 Tax=Mycolicibacterium sphagni TaxID=1786 RepID=UPI0021F2D266|nr:dienelactone hydrolase family protein [Mycolicibacterium sphagni]MCV7178727.1 dienelactone hydrolase family protein [Mycolicibacterium sphagni]